MRFHYFLLLFLFISLEFNHGIWAQNVDDPAAQEDLKKTTTKATTTTEKKTSTAPKKTSTAPKKTSTAPKKTTTVAPKKTTTVAPKTLRHFFRMPINTTTSTTSSTTTTTTTTPDPPMTKTTIPATTAKPEKTQVTSDSSANNTLVIVIVVAVIVLLIISSIVALVFYLFYRCSRRNRNQDSEQSSNTRLGSAQRRQYKNEGANPNALQVPPGYSPEPLDPSHFKHMGALKINKQQPLITSQEIENDIGDANSKSLPLVWDDDNNMVFDIGTEVEEIYDLNGNKVATPQQPASQVTTAPTPLWSMSVKSSSRRNSSKGGGRNLKAIRED